jgi:hypothetical protein
VRRRYKTTDLEQSQIIFCKSELTRALTKPTCLKRLWKIAFWRTAMRPPESTARCAAGIERREIRPA